jgi:hypothetical protein
MRKQNMERVYVFSEDVSLEDHYTAQVFVVRCFDDRFWKVFKHFMRAQGFEHLDPESVAGGAKVFASPEKDGDRDFLLRELEKSIRLHHTKKVWLFTHSDCGAYGGLAEFEGDEEKEFKFHVAEHEKARRVIKNRFSDIPIETFFIDMHGIIKTA